MSFGLKNAGATY
jgi:hypothetical protein